MTNDGSRREPVGEPILGDIPRVVLALAGAIFAVSALQLLGPPDVRAQIEATFALWLGVDPPSELRRLGPFAPYALHVLVHGGWAHLILNLVGLAAFGTATARRLHSPWLFLGFFVLCSIAGAVAEALLPRSGPTYLVGASSGVFGLIAAATYVQPARGGPLPPLLSRTMLTGLAPWTAINAVMAVVGDFGLTGGSIAWAAHYGGLIAGALLFPAFDRLARDGRPSGLRGDSPDDPPEGR